ncbi:MAG: hypothetical protein ICV73_04655 [Acetobacteraceae bacterium]|nr:hypothetical protein [Acetobacteraceae bacterium]
MAETPFRRGASPLLAALAAGAGLFLAWQTAGTLLLLFAGLLFGAFLDAATRGLAYLLPVGRSLRLALVCALLAAAVAWLLAWAATASPRRRTT